MHRVVSSSASTQRMLLSSASNTKSASRMVSRTAFSSSKSTAHPTKARIPLAVTKPQTAQPLQQQQNKSTLALSCSQTTKQQPVLQQLTREQVSSIFWSAAIPMVGFGFMDNFIMITAGSAIENSVGVQLGLATMTAAALGQVVSDVSGVLFGDTLSKVIKVAPAKLTESQKQLSIVRRLRLGGAVLGVMAGCSLGAAALYLIPDKSDQETASVAAATTTASSPLSDERIREQLYRIQSVMNDVMNSDDEAWNDRKASCALYVNDSMADCLPLPLPAAKSSFFDFQSSSSSSKTRRSATIVALHASNDPEVLHTLKEGRVVVFSDTIYVPVLGGEEAAATNNNNEILGIVKIRLENGSFYTGAEIKDAKKVARHLGFFLNHMI